MIKKYLVWILLLYCLFRVPLLLTPLQERRDDFYRGMIATELLEGLKLPFWEYSPDPYGGGALLNGALTAPLFALFGKTMFALKLLPFCWHFLTLIAWYFVFREFFPPLQTFFMLLFFILAPPGVTQYMLFNNGYHFEMILWMALSILVFRRFLEGKLSLVQGALCLGLLGGFTSSLILTNMITVAVIWIYWACRFESPRRKFLFYAVYLAAFLIGFAPWLLYNRQYSWGGANFFISLFNGKHFFAHFAQNFYSVLRQGFADFLSFPGLSVIPRRLLTISYGILYFVALGFLIRRTVCAWNGLKGKFDIVFFGLCFQSLLILLAIVTDTDGESYYLFPLVPFMGMTLVLFAVELKKNGRKILAGYCLTAGLVGNLAVIDFSKVGGGLSQPGYSYQTLKSTVYFLEDHYRRPFPLFQKKMDDFLAGRPQEVQEILYDGLTSLVFEIQEEKDVELFLEYIRSKDMFFQTILFEKFGIQIGRFCRFDPDLLASFLDRWGMDGSEFPQIYRGVVAGLNWTDDPMDNIDSAFAICRQSPLPAKPFCYEGIGALIDPGRAPSKIKRHPAVLAEMERMEAAYLPDYFKGLGQYFAQNFSQDLPQLDRLEGENKIGFEKGVAFSLEKNRPLP